MRYHPATFIRRIAGTFLVFLALFAAWPGTSAMTGDAPVEPVVTHSVAHVLDDHRHAHADDAVNIDDQGAVPSLEDNHGLDDTFDLPPEHAVRMPRLSSVRPADIPLSRHAHVPAFDLRPPIA